MNIVKRLPDAEFEIMKIIWASEHPIFTNEILSKLSHDKSWKPQTVLTLLMRLIERGFLESGKNGKERFYAPLITEDHYLQYEAGAFMNKYYENSLTSFVNTLYQSKNLSSDDLTDLKAWLEERM